MPEWARLFTRLAALSRLILFDKRGTGLSDRIAGIANLEDPMDPRGAVQNFLVRSAKSD
jgi:pimeloyl-ACP methyl ester carboxylesterase